MGNNDAEEDESPGWDSIWAARRCWRPCSTTNSRSLGRKRKRTRGEEGAEVGRGPDRADGRAGVGEAAKLDRTDLKGIGVGVPGPVDLDRGIVLEAVNLGWKNVKLQKALEEAFGCRGHDPERRRRRRVRRESTWGGQERPDGAGDLPGHGHRWRLCLRRPDPSRQEHFGMEIGHIEVTHDGNLCGCGRRGCLETEASRLAISAEIAKAAYRGETPYLRQAAGTDISNIRSGVLADAIAAGDRVVEQIIRERLPSRSAVAVANVVHLICPDTVVLGWGPGRGDAGVVCGRR